MNARFSLCTAFALSFCLIDGEGHAESIDVVSSGELRFLGKPWEKVSEETKGLAAEGAGRFLFAKQEVGEGDFSIRAKLVLERLDGSAASLELGGSRVGFDGKGGLAFVEGPLFKGKPGIEGNPGTLVKPGLPFVMEVIRKAGVARFIIDGREFHRIEAWNAPVGRVGLRPWRNRMTVAEFSIDGNLVTPQAVPPPLFKSGEGGYHTYRIPSLAVTPKGTLLAICEGRKNSSGDSGDIDLLVKRSTDQGKTWSGTQVIWDDAANTCGNPCVVVDEVTGAIILSATWNLGEDHEGEIIAGKSKDTRRVFVMKSDDDGLVHRFLSDCAFGFDRTELAE